MRQRQQFKRERNRCHWRIQSARARLDDTTEPGKTRQREKARPVLKSHIPPSRGKARAAPHPMPDFLHARTGRKMMPPMLVAPFLVIHEERMRVRVSLFGCYRQPLLLTARRLWYAVSTHCGSAKDRALSSIRQAALPQRLYPSAPLRRLCGQDGSVERACAWPTLRASNDRRYRWLRVK